MIIRTHIIIAVLLMPQLAGARIGETVEQCDERYSKRYNTRGNTVTYMDGEYTALCEFWGEVCHFIMYHKGPPTKISKLVMDDVVPLLEDNGKNWRIDKNFKMKDAMWWNSDKSSALFSSDGTMSVTTKEYNIHQAKQEAGGEGKPAVYGELKDVYEDICAKLRKKADGGDAKAQYDLSQYYHLGKGVKQDSKEAAKLMRKAAEQGNIEAEYGMGMFYFQGEGVEQDQKQAMKWYRRAAEQGYDNAQYILGLGYSFGDGVKKNNKEAVKWYRKAAEQGNPNAQYSLGAHYMYGMGVLKDPLMAKKWIKKAFEAGDEEAGEFWKKHELWKY